MQYYLDWEGYRRQTKEGHESEKRVLERAYGMHEFDRVKIHRIRVWNCQRINKQH